MHHYIGARDHGQSAGINTHLYPDLDRLTRQQNFVKALIKNNIFKGLNIFDEFHGLNKDIIQIIKSIDLTWEFNEIKNEH